MIWESTIHLTQLIFTALHKANGTSRQYVEPEKANTINYFSRDLRLNMLLLFSFWHDSHNSCQS